MAERGASRRHADHAARRAGQDRIFAPKRADFGEAAVQAADRIRLIGDAFSQQSSELNDSSESLSSRLQTLNAAFRRQTDELAETSDKTDQRVKKALSALTEQTVTFGKAAKEARTNADDATETFRKKMPRRMRRLANRNALLAKLVDQEVLCVDSLDMDTPRTKDVESTLKALGVNRTCLIALRPDQRNVALSSRNIDDADTIRVDQLNAFELLNHRFLVIDKASLQSFLDGSAWSTGEGSDDKEAA